MLYIARKGGESVIINDRIKVTVTEVRGKSVKLGFEFPQGTQVLREELYHKILKENKMAAQSAYLLGEALELEDDIITPGKAESGS